MGRIFAAILAGGSGSRMGNPHKPKQFMDLAGRPVLAHTLEKFCIVPEIDTIIVLPPANWINQTQDIVNHYLSSYEQKIDIVAGGSTRNDTIMNAIEFIDATYGIQDDDIIITHDSVRPFVSYRIIKDNIEAARNSGACDTVIPASDTIVCSHDGVVISDIPERSAYYQGQTPQTFNILQLRALYESLSDEEKSILTDACKILVLKGEKVALVKGDNANIKLTYTHDLRVARYMMQEGVEHA